MPGSDSQLTIEVRFSRETMYKEVQLVKAYSLQSLIGNAGKLSIIHFIDDYTRLIILCIQL